MWITQSLMLPHFLVLIAHFVATRQQGLRDRFLKVKRKRVIRISALGCSILAKIGTCANGCLTWTRNRVWCAIYQAVNRVTLCFNTFRRVWTCGSQMEAFLCSDSGMEGSCIARGGL